MSLYIGKSSSGVNILHITSDTLQKEALQTDNATSSTCFHSSMEYLTYTEFIPGITPGVLTYSGFTGSLLYTKDIDGYFILLDPSLLNSIVNGTLFTVNADNTLISNGSNLLTGNASLMFTANTAKDSDKSINADSTYQYLFLPISNLTRCSILLFNVTLGSGYLPPQLDMSAGINLTNNSFYINGINLLSFKYVSNVIINNQDTIVSTTGGTLQLINSITTSGSLQLLSNTTETTISNSGKDIFTSIFGSSKLLFSRVLSSTLPEISLSGGTVHDVLIISNIENSLCCCFTSVENGNLPALPVYYSGTDIFVTLYKPDAMMISPVILGFKFTSSGIYYRYDLTDVDTDTTIDFNVIHCSIAVFV